MSTVDLTKVAGFKAVDAEGNDMGVVTLSEMTNMVKESIIQEAVAMQSVSTLAETSTLAATDTYEDKLDISDTFSYVRTLDSSGNPKRTSSSAFATVVGGLMFKLSSETITDLDSFRYDFKIALGRNVLNSPISNAIVCICIKASTSNYYRQFVLAPSSVSIYTRYIHFSGTSVSDKGEWESCNIGG